MEGEKFKISEKEIIYRKIMEEERHRTFMKRLRDKHKEIKNSK